MDFHGSTSDEHDDPHRTPCGQGIDVGQEERPAEPVQKGFVDAHPARATGRQNERDRRGAFALGRGSEAG
jgi:hypothetical protein